MKVIGLESLLLLLHCLSGQAFAPHRVMHKHSLPQSRGSSFGMRVAATRGRTTMLLDASSTMALCDGFPFTNSDISTAFNVANFGPQPLWLLMILIPNTKITKQIMGSWAPIVFFSLVHLFIVIVSASQTDGTAPITEFNDVFAWQGLLSSENQAAMVGMMRYPNFVSEEWSHVLTWDFFVGRLIWLDGIKRGVFTCHSVLLCNLIGPPGLLLHSLTCLLYGKAPLPPTIDLIPDFLDEEEKGEAQG
jgi:hypothetical protein